MLYLIVSLRLSFVRPWSAKQTTKVSHTNVFLFPGATHDSDLTDELCLLVI